MSGLHTCRSFGVDGGDVVTLCDVGQFRGADCGPDGYTVFSFGSRGGLSRVRDSGGQREPLTTLDTKAGEITHRFPQVLPDGRTVLYTAHSNSVNFDGASIVAQPLDGGAQFSVSRNGTLIYLKGSGPDVTAPLVWMDGAGGRGPTLTSSK